jgi:hypothetical protein
MMRLSRMLNRDSLPTRPWRKAECFKHVRPRVALKGGPRRCSTMTGRARGPGRHFCVGLKYFKFGGGWSFLAGIK